MQTSDFLQICMHIPQRGLIGTQIVGLQETGWPFQRNFVYVGCEVQIVPQCWQQLSVFCKGCNGKLHGVQIRVNGTTVYCTQTIGKPLQFETGDTRLWQPWVPWLVANMVRIHFHIESWLSHNKPGNFSPRVANSWLSSVQL